MVSDCVSPPKKNPLKIHHNKQAVDQFVQKGVLEQTLVPLVSKYNKKVNGFIFLSGRARAQHTNSVIEKAKKVKLKQTV